MAIYDYSVYELKDNWIEINKGRQNYTLSYGDKLWDRTEKQDNSYAYTGGAKVIDRNNAADFVNFIKLMRFNEKGKLLKFISATDTSVTYEVYVTKIENKSIPGKLISVVQAEDGIYPNDGKYGNYYYVKKGLANSAPTISGQDKNFGDKNSNFQIKYQVNDTDTMDVLTIVEKIDGVQKKVISPAIRNFEYTIDIDIYSLSIGIHTVVIEVTDGKGGTATRTYTFRRTNSAPGISGKDQSLGDKNLGFQVVYQVNDSDGDSVTVTEKLNSTIIRTLNNAPKGQDITIDISNETLYSLPLLSSNTITIEAKDGNGGVSYRTYTFRKTNSAPLISGVDEYIGKIEAPVTRDYIVTDAEGDNVTIKEKIDDTIIKSFVATLGASNTVTIPKEEWLKLSNGSHTLKIEANDSSSTSIRNFSFEKNESKIKLTVKKPFETDARATKILVTPSWNVQDATAKVEACNNAFDQVPMWEDITAQVFQNKHFNFINETKTADKWGINLRITIEKNIGNQNEVSIRGFGGAFE